MGSRVELFAAIRFDAQRNGLSIRGLADKYGVHRRTVRQALESAIPPPRKKARRARPVLDRVRELIDAMLIEDQSAPVKQRHTAQRVFERLVDEHQAAVSYSTVSKYVRRRRAELAAQARDRAGVVEGFVPQTHLPGQDAEVDFSEVWVHLAGKLTKVALFTLRLSYSGKAIHRAFGSSGQEAFFEGHVQAFQALGGVPAGQIRYDNLRSAVYRVCFGRNRVESQRWIAFRSHYGIEAFYCIPGEEGAHEKGGVEGEIGRFRRRHFVPVPSVESLEELNAMLAEADCAEDSRHINRRANTIGADFAAEQQALRPLPDEPFDCTLTLSARVDRYARIRVRHAWYSVPARLIGRRVRVRLSAFQVQTFDGSRLVATHPRLFTKGGEYLVLDHYLEVLRGKPGALPGSTALVQARAAGVFTATHEAFWSAARAGHGDHDGTRLLIEVLLLHRRMRTTQVLAGIRAALKAGSTSPNVVAIEARKHPTNAGSDLDEQASVHGEPRRSRAAVVTLPARRRDRLPADARPMPSMADYDQLLTQRRP